MEWFHLLVKLNVDMFTRRPFKLLTIDGTETKVFNRSTNCMNYDQCWKAPYRFLLVGSKEFKWNRTTTSRLGNENTWRDSCFSASARINESGIIVQPDKGRQPSVTACAKSIKKLMKDYFHAYDYLTYGRRELVFIAPDEDFTELFKAHQPGNREEIRLDELRTVGDKGM